MKTTLLWIVSLVIALVAGYYQRTTGPTYPASGKATLGATTFAYRLERTHAGAGDQRVAIRPGLPGAEGTLTWRVLGAGDSTVAPMRREGDALVAELPHQPMAGKLVYRVAVRNDGQQVLLPESAPAVIRFRGDVPAWVLIPHIIVMLAALLLAARAALEVFARGAGLPLLTLRTAAAHFLGGFVLGPVVSWYAFRAPWGGFPLGNDPTDNKTLIAMIAWLVALVAVRKARHPGAWVVLAALVMFAVFVIPHSISMPK